MCTSTFHRLAGSHALVAAILLLGCKDATPTWTIDEARVIYTRRGAAGSHLYEFDRATGSSTSLMPDSAPTWGARISPDGSRLAYLSTRDGNYEIYVRNIDDAGVGVNITSHPDYDVLPAWSPDGRQLAFMSTRGFALGDPGPFPGHIYIVGSDGTGLRQVTREPLTSSLGPGAWSPDGRQLVLSRDVGGQLDIFLLNVEDGAEVRVTSNPSREYSAEFSHDGRSLAFHAETDSSSHIVVVDLDGSDRRVLTQRPGFRYTPRWSPDDRWLLYTASADGDDYDLRAVRVDDRFDVSVLATDEDEAEGVWLPTPEPR